MSDSETALLIFLIPLTYLASAMFVSWIGGNDLVDFFDEPSLRDSDVAAWWFWSFIVFVIYPLVAGVYCCIKGAHVLTENAMSPFFKEEFSK